MTRARFLVGLVAPLALVMVPSQGQFGAQPPSDPGPPEWIEVDPNALQKTTEPMRVEVGGIPQDQTVRLRILQDCHGRHRPDLHGEAGCKSPLFDRDSTKANDSNVVRDWLDFQTLEKAGIVMPRNRALWLLASRSGARPDVGALALFGIVDTPCTLWTGILENFHLAPCSPVAVSQSLRRHRGPLTLAGKVFEVRRLPPTGGDRTTPVPGTRGATGVAWQDRETLLVTVVAPGSAAPGSTPEQSALLRLSVRGGKPATLWTTPCSDGLLPVAPLALPGERVAFVRQRLTQDAKADQDPAAMLSVWEKGTVDSRHDIPLPFRVHQLLKGSADGQSILALTLGIGDNRPSFLEIDLAKHAVLNLGFDNSLYQAALHSPRDDTSVLSLEDNSGHLGWDLVLVNAEGEWLRDLQVRPEDDLLPAWRPDGGEIAYLAEVGRAAGSR